MIAAPAVVAQDDGPNDIEQREARIRQNLSVHHPHVRMPEPVAPPGVEAAVVAGFQHRVKDVAVLDDVPAPAAVADVDARTRHVADRAVAHGDVLRHVDLHRRCLLFEPSAARDEAILDQAVGGIIVRQRPGRAVNVHIVELLVVVEEWAAHGFRIADERDAVRAALAEKAAAHGDPAVVVVDKNRVAAELVEVAVLDRRILSAVEHHRAAAIDSPVRAQ